jgi:serine/threonine-protein kinase
MAIVYLAQDIKHERPVALKVLHSELAATIGPERFLREVRTTAGLQHPHILPVHDSGEAAGQLWYTMPYVRGESLRDRLRREAQLPLDDAVDLARQVALALGYAHREGVIHRDLKPENILLSEGQALVADFGVAKALAAGSESRLTETGMAVGTPAYMSPEQAGGGQVDGRSDIYALGCVLYEMLTGEPPFSGPTPQALLAKRILEPVPHVRTLRESVPEPLEQAITRALAKAPADRFASATEFAQALQPTTAAPIATPAGHSVAVHGRAGPRMPVAAMALAIGLLIGLGVLFARRRIHGGIEETGGAKVLAVLPFENLGDSSQAYFADGVGDEVRGKLSQLAGLAVIARASSNEYRRTNKPPQQIARELNAEYLLTGTVRWEKHPDGTSRVRVSPELVRVAPGAAPRTKWQQGFEAALTDVFQVQADIAGQVAQALNLALGDSVKHELAAKPTQGLPAYDAFLRGEAASQGMSTFDPPSLRQAIAEYERAVALDSSFALAWAQLARARARLLAGLGRATPGEAEAAHRAAERALSLAPTRPEGHQALAAYYAVVPPGDLPRAYAEDSTALVLAPGDAGVLGAVGYDELFLGRWEAARRHLEHAARLDPQSGTAADQLGQLLLYARQYPEAERALDHAMQLLPANLLVRVDRALVPLAQGNLARAQAVINAAPKEVDPTALVAFVANYTDLMWVLNEAQQRLLLRLTPSAFDDDRALWGLILAQTYALQGNMAKARVYADSSLRASQQQLQAFPQDAQSHAFLGLTLAYLGQKAAAVREGKQGVQLLPISKNAYAGPYIQHQLARIYLLVGEPEKALDQLEPLLKMPYVLSPGWLKIDPNFAPLRGNPRFERLVNGS